MSTTDELTKSITESLTEIEELLKAAHYWKNKDPKKYRAMLDKLAAERKKPGSKERGYQQVLQAKRREKGGSGTTSGQGRKGHASGHMKSDTGTAAKRYASAEKKHGKKMSIDRKDNKKGYAAGNTRLISQKYNKGDEKYAKKAPELKKFLETENFMTLLKARCYELGKEDLVELIDELFGASDVETNEINDSCTDGADSN